MNEDRENREVRTLTAYVVVMLSLAAGGMAAWGVMRPLREAEPSVVILHPDPWNVVLTLSLLIGIASGVVFHTLAVKRQVLRMSILLATIGALALPLWFVSSGSWLSVERFDEICRRGHGLLAWLLWERWHIYDMLVTWLAPQVVATWLSVALLRSVAGKPSERAIVGAVAGYASTAAFVTLGLGVLWSAAAFGPDLFCECSHFIGWTMVASGILSGVLLGLMAGPTPLKPAGIAAFTSLLITLAVPDIVKWVLAFLVGLLLGALILQQYLNHKHQSLSPLLTNSDQL